MEGLKSCPFCGQKPRIKSGLNSEGKPFFQVTHDCMNLLSQIKTLCHKTQAEAISDWNRRAAPENKPLTVEQLRKMETAAVYSITNTMLGSFWALVDKVYTDKVKLITTDNSHILMLHLDAVKIGSVKLYARKPEGSESP